MVAKNGHSVTETSSRRRFNVADNEPVQPCDTGDPNDKSGHVGYTDESGIKFRALVASLEAGAG
jgi:hypothetical protein